MYKRPVYQIIYKRLQEKRRFIQILSGPRQTGKTTLARQILSELNFPCHYATADEPLPKERIWIDQQWETARLLCGKNSGLLVLDEIQKIPGWSETVKKLWDEDTHGEVDLRVLILGSSPLLIQKGLTESLAGRFEAIPILHWSFPEMHDAFGWDQDTYIFFGGYPGSAPLISDEERWRNYIKESLIETSISRDILLMTRIDKPVLLRRLFELGCQYSGRILSYQKMLGQLQDAGNTTTLAHYLNLLGQAGLIIGLSKFAGENFRQRASSPKFVVFNTALISAVTEKTRQETREDHALWGRLFESAVGAHLANAARGHGFKLFYWLDRNREVDFVLKKGDTIVGMEVKSGKKRETLPGLEAFSKKFTVKKKWLIGSGGMSFDDFSRLSPEKYFD